MNASKKVWLFPFLILLLVTGGCDLDQDRNFISAKVIKVVDGDTLNVEIDGKKETIRLLLIDTPETVHPIKPVQPFGPEASEFLKDKLNGNDIRVELGIGERDKYGRLLAYVYVEDQMVNKQLLERGLARVAYVFEPNTKYIDEFYDIQKQAQQKEVGIWSIENYATDQGFREQEESNDAHIKNLEVSENCSIKGNINSNGEKIYHTEKSPSYQVTKPEEIFCSEEEAVAAGYRAVRK